MSNLGCAANWGIFAFPLSTSGALPLRELEFPLPLESFVLKNWQKIVRSVVGLCSRVIPLHSSANCCSTAHSSANQWLLLLVASVERRLRSNLRLKGCPDKHVKTVGACLRMTESVFLGLAGLLGVVLLNMPVAKNPIILSTPTHTIPRRSECEAIPRILN